MRADVQEMLANEGLYLAIDSKHVNAMVPIVSRDGKLFSMRIDCELKPEKFFDRTDLHGPFWPLRQNLLSRLDNSSPWCEACQSYHSKPRDAEHKAQLGCTAA